MAPPPPPPPGGGGADTTPPETTITKGPKKRITTTKAKISVKFKFTSSEVGSTFKCKLDKKPSKSCSSPKSYKVKPGKHRFSLTATDAADAAGNADPAPAKTKFKVVRE